MGGQKSILEAFDGVEKTRDQLVALFRNKPAGWKSRYLALRREHQTQFVRINQLGEAWFAAQGDTADARRFRELLSKMRGVLATHQANWPVINIGPDDPDYRASMDSIDAARLDLVAFVRSRMTG